MSFEKIPVAAFNIMDFISGFAAAPYVGSLVLRLFLPVREKRWARPLLYAGCALLSLQAIYVGDPVNILGILPVFFFIVFLCCGGPFLQRLSVSLIFSGFSLSFSALVDSFLHDDPALWMAVGSFMKWGVLRLAVWLAVYFALKRFAPEPEYGLPPKLWALVDMLTLAPFAATLITVALGDMEARGVGDFLLLLVAQLTSFGLLWAVTVLARQQKLEQEKSFYEMNRMYYRNLEQEQFQVRRLRHDMANHLQTMSALPGPKLRAYLDDLIRSPAMEHMRRYSENRVVNIVLSSKEAVMEQKKIAAEIETSVPQKLPVHDADLCALFANSLDNAIEACEKLPENRRRVSVRARADKGLFVLQVQNSADGKSAWRNGLPVTTKQEPQAHGFGLAGIRKIAARYGGSMEITEDGTQFTLLVYFTLEEETGKPR
mgnify:FL=1